MTQEEINAGLFDQCKQLQRELETQRALSADLYERLHRFCRGSLGRECYEAHGLEPPELPPAKHQVHPQRKKR